MSTSVVTVRNEALKGEAEVGEFVIQKFLLFFVRATIVWGFLAIFFPQFGATYILVLAGLFTLKFAKGTHSQAMVTTINRKYEKKAQEEKRKALLNALAGKA